MQAELNILNKFQYSKKEWTWAKVLVILLWLVAPIVLLNKYHTQPFPEGICQFFNCSVIAQKPFLYIVIAFSFIAATMYVTERFIKTGLFLLAVTSVLIFSIERSNGIYHREELFSLIFIVQFIAYLRYHFANEKFKTSTTPQNVAMFYSISIIAAAYMMAGISKLQTSGISWINDSPNIALQTLQSFEHKAIDNGHTGMIPYGYFIAGLILKHQFIVKCLFAFALFAELFAFVACYSKKHARVYGTILIGIHLAMFILLFVKLVVFILAVTAFMVNLPQLFMKEKKQT